MPEYERTGRYSKSIVAPNSSQYDPLSMVVQVNYPSYIKNIGDAVAYTLEPTGYRLPHKKDWLDPAFLVVGNKPLPITQRLMKGRVNEVLRVLVGPRFVVVRDDVNRFVTMDYMEEWGNE
ncbi:hypothetical protein AB9X29_003720 [Vibrio vulnificus]